MTERMERKRLDLIARQQAGEMMPCPRCGADSMKRPIHTNAMSRTGALICASESVAEAFSALFGVSAVSAYALAASSTFGAIFSPAASAFEFSASGASTGSSSSQPRSMSIGRRLSSSASSSPVMLPSRLTVRPPMRNA